MAIKQKRNKKYLVDERDEYGERIQRTFSRLSDAKAFKATLTVRKNDRKLVVNGLKQSRYPFNQSVDDYELTKVDLRPSSQQRYKFVFSQVRKFAQAIGIQFIDEFTPDVATLFYNELTKEKDDPRYDDGRKIKVKPKTVNFFLTAVRAFFQHEYVKDHITRNPMLHIKNLKVEKRKPEYFTVEELKSFFSQLMHDSYRSAFMAFLFSGLRFAELANLTWDDIDFSRCLMVIRSRDDFKTKTHNSERAIPMNSILLGIVRDRFDNKQSSKYVFTSPNGCRLRERRTLQICKEIASSAGITSNAYLHKFRHTYATMLIHKGVSIQNIKELLGHWSVIETERYAHNKSDHLFPDVQKLDNLLSA